MSETTIRGSCPEKFNAVKAAFEANFAEGAELGARFAVMLDGELVVDLLGGWADRDRTAPFAEDTLAPIHSCTKAITAFMMARLVQRGKLSYEQTVSSVWPEFAKNGKRDITVGQVMSHQAGLPGFLKEMDPADWMDHDLIIARLEAMEPMWAPGTASGYHPVTFGFLAGDIFQRVDGRSVGRAFAEDVARRMELDVWLGLPEREHHRVAETKKPRELPKFGEPTDALKAAFQTRWSSPYGLPAEKIRRMEFPAFNGQATAKGLARMMSLLATDETGMAEVASAERIAGQDLVLPFKLSWGAGFLRSQPNGFYGPGENAFGHSGRGGACCFADPDRKLAAAYVPTQESASLIGDPRAKRLIDALYESL